jgi:hypothetical protein
MSHRSVDTDAVSAKRESILEEYKSLRTETLKCVEFRYQIFNFTLIVAGIILTTGISDKGPRAVLLLYPILSFFLASAFVYNSILLVEIGSYIRDELERRDNLELRWANHFQHRYKGIAFFEIISTYGLFLSTQILSILVYFNFSPELTGVPWVLFSFSLLAIILTIVVLLYPVAYHWGVLSKSNRG